MDEIERKIRQRLKDDFAHYSERCLKIRTKEHGIQPFNLNTAQRYIHGKVEDQKRRLGKVRCIILKGRQQGCSTLIEGRFYWLVTHHFGIRAFILTHDNDATNNLFEMALRYHEHCPTVVCPRIEASNAKELIFAGLDSGYRLGTAGNKAVGRSSTIQLFHGSEVAFWPNAAEHAMGIMQAIPNGSGSEIFLESTAAGVGNYFHQQWQLAEAGQSDFMPIFVPWFWQDEYIADIPPDFKADDEEQELIHLYKLTPAQVMWRRLKIKNLSVGGLNGEKAFKQEYPCNSTEAFQLTGEDNYIPSDIVMAARKTNLEAEGPLIIGVDPARFGDDRTAIIRRKARVAYGLETYIKRDNMEIVGILHQIIINERPVKMCIDMGGMPGIYDRLKELGHGDIVVPINFGAHALNAKRYANKRAEMWGLMYEWLHDIPVQIPDRDSLHADLCGIKYKPDSNSRLVMERKEDMKSRSVRSPDEADALALTFALPDFSLLDTRGIEEQKVSNAFEFRTKEIDYLRKKAYG